MNNAPTIILSAAALIISIKSWYQTRIFYDLEVYIIGGTSATATRQLDEVKQKLNTGKYTILNTFEESYENNGRAVNSVSILLGKVKK